MQGAAHAGDRSKFVRLSEQAVKEQRSHIGYLEALLAMEAEERDRHAVQKRLRDAKLTRLKTLEEFDFNVSRGRSLEFSLSGSGHQVVMQVTEP